MQIIIEAQQREAEYHHSCNTSIANRYIISHISKYIVPISSKKKIQISFEDLKKLLETSKTGKKKFR